MLLLSVGFWPPTTEYCLFLGCVPRGWVFRAGWMGRHSTRLAQAEHCLLCLVASQPRQPAKAHGLSAWPFCRPSFGGELRTGPAAAPLPASSIFLHCHWCQLGQLGQRLATEPSKKKKKQALVPSRSGLFDLIRNRQAMTPTTPTRVPQQKQRRGLRRCHSLDSTAWHSSRGSLLTWPLTLRPPFSRHQCHSRHRRPRQQHRAITRGQCNDASKQ